MNGVLDMIGMVSMLRGTMLGMNLRITLPRAFVMAVMPRAGRLMCPMLACMPRMRRSVARALRALPHMRCVRRHKTIMTFMTDGIAVTFMLARIDISEARRERIGEIGRMTLMPVMIIARTKPLMVMLSVGISLPRQAELRERRKVIHGR